MSTDAMKSRSAMATTASPVVASITMATTTTPECFKPVVGSTTPRPSPSRRCGGTSPMDAAATTIVPRFEMDIDSGDTNSVVEAARRPELPEEQDSSIVVVVRVRPLATVTFNIPSDDGSGQNIPKPPPKSVLRIDGNTLTVEQDAFRSNSSKSNVFTFDHCLWSGDRQHPQYADQQRVYEVIAQPLLDKAFEGFNTCIFAYGQTGSGKSYSVMGKPDDAGIIPRFSQDLFERIRACEKRNERVCIEISYFEIYNEKIHDLLASSGDQSKKAPIKIREHNVLGPYVVGLSTFVVTCHDDLASWLSLGNKQRATAATVMNEKSSRSHSVFTIVITRVQMETIDGEVHEHSRRSKVNIVDLAGSERVDSNETKQSRLKEGASINKSLLTLGRVIAQLSEASLAKSCVAQAGTAVAGSGRGNGGRKATFIPYRDSVLTWLLKESLGGNSQTTMLATVSPSSGCVEETLSTLRYARQARTIVNVVHVNEDPKARLIRELRAEIGKLRDHQQSSRSTNAEIEIQQLRKKLEEKELLLRQATAPLQEKLEQATKSKAQEAEHLQKVGVALAINNELPNLVNLNEDPQLSEALVYVLRKGSVTVGRMKSTSQRDIQLKGSLIAEYHCTITNMDDTITLIPNTKGQTFVNGYRIREPKHLHHGDRIVLGGEHYFRLNFSAEVAESQLNKSANQKDFAYARAELLRVQEARMTEELEKARQKTRREMLEEIENMRTQTDLELSMQRREYEDRIRELSKALQEHDIRCESARRQLEAEKNLLEFEVRTEKRRSTSAAKETAEVSECSPLKTDFLDFIQNLIDAETSVLRPANEFGGPMLYELDTMIREAESVSLNRLNGRLRFEQYDQLMDKEFVVVVRVTDMERHQTIDWQVDTFVERLELIRRIGEGETDLELFDETDEWADVDRFPVSLTPKDRELIQQVKSLGNGSLMMDSFDASSPPSSNSGPHVGQTASPSTAGQFVAICADHCSSMVECFSEFSKCDFQVDACKLLTNLTEVKSHVAALQGATTSKDIQAIGNTTWTLYLNSLVSTLLIRASKLLPTSPSNPRCKKQAATFGRLVRSLGDSVSFCLQGIGRNSLQDVRKATESIADSILDCGDLIGQLTLSLGITMDPKDRDQFSLEVNNELGIRFLSGIESVVVQVFANAVDKMDSIELRVNTLVSDSILNHSKGVEKSSNLMMSACVDSVSSISAWVKLYREMTVATSSRRTTNCSRGIIETSTESQQVCLNLSLLVEAIVNLCDDIEMTVRSNGGGVERADLDETLIVIAEIDGAVKTLFALAESRFSTLVPQPKSVDLCGSTQAIVAADHNLKKIVRQILDCRRHSSRGSGGDSPAIRASPCRRPLGDGSSERTSDRRSMRTRSSPTAPVVAAANGDETSVWESSLPDFRSYTADPMSPSEFGLERRLSSSPHIKNRSESTTKQTG